MRVLVIGSGGREHALCWKLRQSPRLKKLYCAPGNAGISKIADIVDIKANDIEVLCNFALKNKIDLTVVGPEAPLADGIVDRFKKEKLRIFGPCFNAARLEASKAFAKRIMERFNIPTAKAQIFTHYGLAEEYLKKARFPVAVKADGLCAGKGVKVCKTQKEACDFVNGLMGEKVFGDAGNKVLIEEALTGEEASFMVVTDGKHILPLPTAQDHKRLLDNDEGPNTGGMGACSPAHLIDKKTESNVLERIILPVLEQLDKKERFVYKGLIYAGLILTEDGPKVLEFNIRFGDPEAQAVLPRISSDLLDIIEGAINGDLNRVKLELDKRVCVCVVLASAGYPEKPIVGKVIKGLDEANKLEDILIFHAGTKMSPVTSHQPPVKYLTNGGRVLNIVALGDNIQNARNKVYNAINKIHFDGMHYRKDIGCKALASS